MKILALEPYYDGSHKAFIEDWIANSRHEIKLLTLPGHHWKWRMRHSGWSFAKQANELFVNENFLPDAFFCSSMLNVAEFRGLLTGELRKIPAVCYFHENQLSYPDPTKQSRDIHFGLSNISSAIAAEKIIFNSEFHRNEFFEEATKLLKAMPDENDAEFLQVARKNSTIIHPGIKPAFVEMGENKKFGGGKLKIMWAARWEHDKNFDDFAKAIDLISSRPEIIKNIEITVAGQSFRQVPEIFEKFKADHGDKISHWGFCSGLQYKKLLSNCDVFVSTANHEFFGISVMEAAAASCHLLLPQRLSYSDLFINVPEVFYGNSAKELTQKIGELIEYKRVNKTLFPPDQQIRNIALGCKSDKIAALLDDLMLETPVKRF